MAPTEVDVLIIGAGPSGLFAAVNLIRCGLSVRIIEKQEAAEYGRAVLLLNRSIEIFQQTDLLEEFLRDGKKSLGAWSFQHGKEPVNTINYERDAKDTEYKYTLFLRQFKIEHLLAQNLAKYGVKVERPMEIIDFDILDDSVISTLKDGTTGETVVVSSKYLLGCDGAHSFVRKRLGFSLKGDTEESFFARIDGIMDTDIPRSDDSAIVQSEKYGMVFWLPLDHGTSRIGFPITKGDKKSRSEFKLDELMDHVKQSIAPWSLNIKKVHWWTVYQVGQRIVDKFEKQKRVFLCGDACHTHTSSLAQGMNLGLQDSHNLAWKLFWYERMGASSALLDTYQQERRSIAEQVIEIDKALARLTASKPPKDQSKDLNTTFIEEFNNTVKKHTNFSLGFGIEYAESIINIIDFEAPIPSVGPDVRPGQRSPDGWLVAYPSAMPVQLFLEMPHVGCFYILVFVSELSANEKWVQKFEEHLHRELSFTRRYGRGPVNASAFKFLFITTTLRDEVERSPLSAVLAAAPYRMYIDVKEDGSIGKLHERYGVDAQGAIVVVRPDGWAGSRVGLKSYEKLDQYFGGFLELQV